MTTLQSVIDSTGIEYRADFVPFSMSRNAKSHPNLNELQLNWKIRISKGSQSIVTDYSSGLGHIPGHKYEVRPTVDYVDGIRHTCETGKFWNSASAVFGGRQIPAPKLSDVLYSLLLDASAIDSSSFEEWASEWGYDTDSREAEKNYRTCLGIGLKMRAILGDAKMSELREAFQDY